MKKHTDQPLRWANWLPALLWMAVIFAFSSHRNIETGLDNDFYVKKTAHLIEYAVLFAFYYHALNGSLKFWVPKTAMMCWLFAVLYAITDEIHQFFVPTRSARVLDVIIDSSGALITLLVLYCILRVRHPK